MRARTVIPLLLPLLNFAATAVSASTAHLVADLRPGVQDFDLFSATDFQSYTPVNGRVVFLSFDSSDAFQCNLWATDGTAGGTERLADLCGEISDSNDLYKTRILATNGEIAFVSDPLSRLWRTDGTAAGTFPLRNVEALGGVIGPDGHTFLFTGCTEAQGCELWVSDGTPAGTRMLRALGRGSASSNPTAFTLHGRRLLFGAIGPQGPGLWATDGTAAGTVQLVRTRGIVQTIVPLSRQIYFGTSNTSTAEAWILQERAGTAAKIKTFLTDFRAPGIRILTAGGRVFLTVTEPEDRSSVFLWETGGTPRSTRLLGEFSFIPRMFELGRRIVFAASRDARPRELWFLDPEMRSPRRLQGCPRGGCPRLDEVSMVQLGNRILFSGWDAARGHELWESDGTARGTRLLKNLCPGPCDGGPGRFRVVLDRVLFSTITGGLWETDGTTAGTLRLASRRPDDPFPDGPALDVAEMDGSKIVFTGFDPVNGLQPWVSDLKPAGTRPIEILGLTLGASSQIGAIVPFGSKVLFAGCDDTGFRAFVSDGIAAGTVPLPLPALACEDFRFLSGKAVGDLAFFEWDRKLWRTDGTPGGTLALGPSDIQFPRGMAELDGRLLLVLDPPSFGPSESGWLWDYWTSDGTPAGTRLAFQVRLGGTPSPLAVVGDEAFFTAQSPETPFPVALWRTDGTAEGTRALLSLRTTTSGLRPEVVRLDGRTFFLGESEERPFGTELWETDGTAEGTRPVFPDEGAPGRPQSLQSLTVFQGDLYFFAELPGSAHTGLWRTDGTAEGTVLLKAINLQQTEHGLLPPLLTPAGDALFFRANDGVHGGELWATDGTPEGTRLVRDVAPGKRHSRVDSLTAAGGRLFFVANDGEHGLELWESDGTAEGTRLVEDVFPGPTAGFPQLLTPAGNSLYFTANDGPHGRELWEAR